MVFLLMPACSGPWRVDVPDEELHVPGVARNDPAARRAQAASARGARAHQARRPRGGGCPLFGSHWRHSFKLTLGMLHCCVFLAGLVFWLVTVSVRSTTVARRPCLISLLPPLVSTSSWCLLHGCCCRRFGLCLSPSPRWVYWRGASAASRWRSLSSRRAASCALSFSWP